MSKLTLKTVLILCALFLFGAIISFCFEHDFRNLLFKIYTKSTSGNLTFHENRKEIHFPSGFFVSAFGVYLMLLYILNLKNNWKKILLMLTFNCLIFFLSVGIYSYFNAHMNLISCTACDDGTLKLYKDDLNSDKIFFISLLFTILPYLFNLFKKRHFIFSSRSNEVKSPNQ
jgi:hypothetical protein